VLDTDMVSGMLSAIRDFVRDSFGSTRRETLDTLQVGGLTVWIEQGPLAVLAGVIRGTPPQALRERFRQALEGIHQAQGAALQGFDGDAAALAPTQPALLACLEARYGKAPDGTARPRRVTPLALVAAGLALALAGFAFAHVEEARRWERFVQRLRSEPGLVVTQAAREGGLYRVAGLRDALARDPRTLATEAGLAPGDLQFAWEPYLSLRPEFVRQRQRAALAAPGPTAATEETTP
jgi:hypothetical protein